MRIIQEVILFHQMTLETPLPCKRHKKEKKTKVVDTITSTRLFTLLKPKVRRRALNTLNLILNRQHPMVALCTRASAKNDAAAFATQLGDTLELSPFALLATLLAAAGAFFGAEPAFCFAVPDDKRRHDVFVGRCPAVSEVDAGKGVVTWFVCVKGLVLVE